MARTGIFKWDVKDARDKLVQEGRHPSIDAVRSKLGNTGSKSTIHRFLKELDEEEAGSSKVAVSDALQALVSQLSERLLHEAQVEIEAASARFAAERAALKAECVAARQDAAALRESLESADAALATERSERKSIEAELHEAHLHVARLTEQAKAYEQRLAEQSDYQSSLEAKHENARQALEHFRAASKEQREQECLRHDHQVQQLQMEIRTLNSTLTEKLTQLTRISADAASLSTEIAMTRHQLAESRADKARLEKEVTQLHSLVSKAAAERVDLDRRLSEARETEGELKTRLSAADERARALDISAARSEVMLESHKALVAELERDLSLARQQLALKEATSTTNPSKGGSAKATDSDHVE